MKIFATLRNVFKKNEVSRCVEFLPAGFQELREFKAEKYGNRMALDCNGR